MKSMKLSALAVATALTGMIWAGPPAVAQQAPIKVGVLHSLSGTMAISETTLKDTILMMVEEQNKTGGLLGRKLEPVVVDPASNWPLFAEKMRELLQVHKVDVVFGNWTSVSRKSVLPVVEELNGLLFYPVQYEGEESSRNVFYTGAAPNQQAIPAVEYLMGKDGGEAKRWVLLGTDYVYPRTTNKILQRLPEVEGRRRGRHHGGVHAVRSLRLADDRRAREAASPRQGKKTAVVSTINGDANVPFYKELGNQGIKADRHPGRRLLGRRGRARRHRHQAAGRPSRRLELLPVGQEPDQRRVREAVAGLHQEPEARHQRPDGGALYRLQDVGAGGAAGRVDRRRRGPPGDVRPEGEVAVGLRGRDAHRTTTCPSRS